MSRAAVIVEGVVVNILDVPADYAGPLPLVAETVQIGALEVGNDLVNPAPEVQPAVGIEITNTQLEVWLDANGFPGGLQNSTVQAVLAAADGETRIRARTGRFFSEAALAPLAAALEIQNFPQAFLAASQL